jgi:UDP-3-O-[3-hydroxymyristoyl] glucosamine N-acyltransferase
VLYPGTVLGDRVVIHAGTVIGADGFGYTLVEGKHTKAAQLGWVQIGDDVEIGANSAVDRGAFGATRIGNGTKIDNFVQIGHNCHIGAHNLICAHVGISGSVTTGKYVVLAGQVGIADHTVLADRVVVAAQSGIISDVEEGMTLMGSPAVPHREKLQQVILSARLPQIQKELKRMRKELDSLQYQHSATDSAIEESLARNNRTDDASSCEKPASSAREKRAVA